MAVEVGDDAVEVVGDERAAGAAGVLLVDAEPEPEHEVVDEQLGSPVEELRERLLALVRVEPVVLFDGDPGQLAAPLRELVAEPAVLLFADEQLLAGGEPSCSRAGLVIRHVRLLSSSSVGQIFDETCAPVRRCSADQAATTAWMATAVGSPLSSWAPRFSNSIPEPATRSLTVLETSTSPAPARAATRAPV